MGKGTTITEQFQHFVEEVRESFWGDLYGKTRLAWKKFCEAESRRVRDRSVVAERYEGAGEERRDYRNGYCERDL